MKKLFFAVSLFLLMNNSNAQITADWKFDDINAYNYYPTTNIINNGTDTYVCSQSGGPLKIAYIFRLDSLGSLIAQDSVHNFEYSILDNKRMIRDNGGSFYLCGNVYDSMMNSKIRLIKYDSLLNRIWDISFIGPNTQTSSSTGILYSQTENKIYLVGEKYDSTTRTIVLKFDTNGNVLWESQDSLTSTYALTAYTLDHSGNVIFGGYAFISGFGTGEDFLVSKIDTSGALAWMVREDGSYNSDDWVFDICTDNNNNIYASGIFEDSARHKIFKYDPSGNRMWTRNIPDIGLNKIAADPAGSLYIVGYDSMPDHEFIIYKYDSAGNHIHTTFSDVQDNTGYTQDYFVGIQTNNSGDVFLLHSADSSNHLRWLVAKLDSSLTFKWTFIYPGSTINPATPSALCLVDEGFIVSGKIDNFLRVVHFQETFPTTINENNDEHPLSLWPNPASESLFFLNEKLIPDEIIFKIYDINSKIVMEGALKTGSENNFNVSVSSLKNGIYFLTTLEENSFRSGKFMVHR